MAGIGRAARWTVAMGLTAGISACAPVAVDGEAEVARGGDPCGAEALEGVVGTSVGALEAEALPEPRRVIFPGMAVTQDFVPERLNVEIGPDDRVARVYCG
jgi:hypothetical protein